MTTAALIAALFIFMIIVIAYAICTDDDVKKPSEDVFDLSPEDIANVKETNGLPRDSKGRFAKRRAF